MKPENVKEEVVISGVGGTFPKCFNIDEFKEKLLNSEDLMGARWKSGEKGVTNTIATIPEVNTFDTSFFSIHRAQSNYMDPMQRLVLERTFEALIDAGVGPSEIKGKRVAVYTSSCVAESENFFFESMVRGFEITGHTRSMMANRISYWLNLKGPSCSYESNWLGGADALQAGFQAVSEGFCESAIVATANIALTVELSWLYHDMGLLAHDGITRPFCKDVTGYGRGDGIVVLYLQRARDARRVYASVLGVEAIFSGSHIGSMCKIDANDMAGYLRDFYSKCKVNPADVGFVECYATGQKERDEAEIEALDKVCCKDRKEPLLIGSVKSNTGHAEASAVLLSLAKVLIAMETGIIPANINYEEPNTNLSAITEGRLKVVDKNTRWDGSLAAVNCLGIGSSFGHILLKANPKIRKEETSYIPKLVALSTRTEEGIQKSLDVLKAQEKIDPEYAALIHDTYKRSIHGHVYRGYIVADCSPEPKTDFEYCPGGKRPIWFVYSGMGSQWCKMAADLMGLPLFAESIHKSHKILEPKGIDLLKIVTEDDNTIFDNILHSFVGIAAVQIALTDALRAIGIVPDGIIGHSVGELGCAYADGCLTAEQMILSAYSRGRASLEAELIPGMMAAVGKGYNQMKDLCPPTIEVACHNGPESCTISGPTNDMEVFVKELQDQGTFARLVNVSNIAYHSRYIKPAAPLLLKYLQEVIPDPLPRSSKWISTSIPEDKWEESLSKTSSAEYHTNNLLSFVLFEEGSKHIPKDAIVIEIAPHGLLQAILKRSLNSECTNVPLTHKTSKNGLTFLLSAIGKLYLQGLELNLSALYPAIEYPVSRGTASLTPLINWEHSDKWYAGYEEKSGMSTCAKILKVSLVVEDHKYLSGHQLKNNIVIPISVYLAELCGISFSFFPEKPNDVMFENIKLNDIIVIPVAGLTNIQFMVRKGSGGFDICSEGNLIGSGTISIPEKDKFFVSMSPINVAEDAVRISDEDFYLEMSHRGYMYEGAFRLIKSVVFGNEGIIATVQWNNCWEQFVNGMIQIFLFRKGENKQNLIKVIGIQKIAVSFSLLPSEPTELQVTYDYSTGIIWAEGIQIFGIRTKPLALANSHTSIDSLELTALNNAVYEDIESGINFSLHMAIDNFDEYSIVESIMLVEIETANPSLQTSIKNVVNKYTRLKANVSTVKNSAKIIISPAEPMLVVVNDIINESFIKLLTSSHIFMLVRKDNSTFNNPVITQVAQFSVQGKVYALLRKRSTASPVIVDITSPQYGAEDFSKDAQWVTQLKSTVETITSGKRVYLLSRTVPAEGIYNFVKKIRTYHNMNSIRFVFILDKMAPVFSSFEPVYQRIFKDDLILTVIHNGFISTYIPSPIEFKAGVVQETANYMNDSRFDFIGINLNDETLITNGERKVELGSFDYSSVTPSGQKVMGIAHYDTNYNKLVTDNILNWNVPPRWTLHDAASVPYAYTMAYYALIHETKIKPSETVLIHGGCTPIGMAALSIASARGCTVFTTCTTDFQKAFLKKNFDFLGDRNVFNACNVTFEPMIMMATGGEGVHVVLSCLTGSSMNATLRCVAAFGRIVQVGKRDVENDNEIGLKVFLRNVSFGCLMPEDVYNASPNIKKRVYEYVQKGLDEVTIRPLHRQVIESCDSSEVLKIAKKN